MHEPFLNLPVCEDELKLLPGADYCFKEIDHIMLIGKAEDIEKIV